MFTIPTFNIIKILKIAFLLINFIFFTNCGIYKKVDKSVPISGEERARKNVNEGRGISIGNMGKQSTTYEFSSSNPMWRASIEILDFIPFDTVDYSGGIIITDWYSDNKNEAIKITVRFLNNEIGAANLKIIVHKKICDGSNNCKITELNTKLKNELAKQILSKASQIEKENNKKK